VELIKSDEGYAVSCPDLRGCWSQGATEEEALANIQSAIVEYLEAEAEGSALRRGARLLMGKLPGVNHQRAIRAFEQAGYEVIRDDPQVSMSNGRQTLTIPRDNPVDAYTMFGIVRDAGLTVEQFRKLL